jgi:hypothetical protein
MAHRLRSALLAGLTLVTVTVSAQPRLTKQDAERFQSKLNRIVEFGNTVPGRGAPSLSTPLTDAELNAYLRFLAGDQIPVGIVEPTLSALGNGRVSGRAIVDLDAVRKQKERGLLDPMNLLSGRLPVTAAGRLTTKNGIGQFSLETAEVSGMTLPKSILQELLSHYSRTSEKPSGINMDDPFELPARIREIEVGSGTATIIQR